MSRFPTLLIVIGLAMLSLSSVHRYFYNRSLSLSDALLASYAREPSTRAYPIIITVDDKIHIPIVEAGLVKGALSISPTVANHLHTSAVPGEAGNGIIYGHNTNKIFGYLVDSKVGDPVSIRTDDGKEYLYKISEIQIVWPSQTALLAPTATEVLTLYTCTGLLDSLRFVVRALPNNI